MYVLLCYGANRAQKHVRTGRDVRIVLSIRCENEYQSSRDLSRRHRAAVQVWSAFELLKNLVESWVWLQVCDILMALEELDRVSGIPIVSFDVSPTP